LTNPDPFEYKVAETLNNLGILYLDTQKFKEAEDAFEEARDKYQNCAKRHAPPAYEAGFARVLDGLTRLKMAQNLIADAQKYGKEAVEVHDKVWQKNPSGYGNYYAESLMLLAYVYKQISEKNPEICELAQKAEELATKGNLKNLARKMIEDYCR